MKSKPKVFIVDDEPLLAEMLTDYLKEKNEGFIIESFSTGEACLKKLHEQPDAIVLDYYLNSKQTHAANGIDVLKEIKRKDKKIPVIMLSSQTSYVTASTTIRDGAVHYVIKGTEAFEEIYNVLKFNM